MKNPRAHKNARRELRAAGTRRCQEERSLGGTGMGKGWATLTGDPVGGVSAGVLTRVGGRKAIQVTAALEEEPCITRCSYST